MSPPDPPMPAFQPAPAGRKVDHVLQELRQAITSGGLAPGDRLPPERDLAAQFGVGRSSVREALSVLQMSGLLDVRHGQGTYVLHVPPPADLAPDAATPNEQLDFLPLTEARYAFELGVARLAADRRDPAGLSALRHAVTALRASAVQGDAAGFERANLDFHLALAATTGNAALNAVAAQLHAPLASQGARRVRRAFYDVTPARIVGAVPLHEAVADAVTAAQPEAAMRAVMAHYANVAAPLLGEDPPQREDT
ncbi:FadR/GntR family transcriptional regulator [Deinococcus aquiradiocola]|uniref:GntR family transcriptional regulator n=1 Tax=Deinococcus aquiradiocola TaxID=393059 RepID=A0A917PKC0_9DEIO|nr:FadR/GntR family transcriptional regulator [Deinococcus aquiradiocola]GGJ82071.1 GntR family transcriptional regulator [Deinococcus aquiradiocola]